MAIFGIYLLQEIFYYLDLKSLQNCTTVSKKWNKIICKNHFWKNKFSTSTPSTYHSGPYFKYSTLKGHLEHLNLINYEFPDNTFIKPLSLKLSNPQNLKITSTTASSTDRDQVSQNLLIYDDLFWSSAPNQSSDSDEFLILELESKSLIFTVNFKLFRAVYQEGTLYPPKFIKVSIGTTKDSFEYETDNFEVNISESYNTILILPNIVLGKFVKLTLIGKQSKEPGTELWYNVLRFVEIIGYPEEFVIDPVLEMCREGKFKNFLGIFSPFYFERIERYNNLNEFFNSGKPQRSDISTYFSEVCKLPIWNGFYLYCEIVGNYFFDLGEYDQAKAHYIRIIDIWGFSRYCIVKKDFAGLTRLMSETNPRRPNTTWVRKNAKQIGGVELENEVLAFLQIDYSLV